MRPRLLCATVAAVISSLVPATYGDTLQIVLESTLRFTQTGEQITAAARLAGRARRTRRGSSNTLASRSRL